MPVATSESVVCRTSSALMLPISCRRSSEVEDRGKETTRAAPAVRKRPLALSDDADQSLEHINRSSSLLSNGSIVSELSTSSLTASDQLSTSSSTLLSRSYATPLNHRKLLPRCLSSRSSMGTTCIASTGTSTLVELQQSIVHLRSSSEDLEAEQYNEMDMEGQNGYALEIFDRYPFPDDGL